MDDPYRSILLLITIIATISAFYKISKTALVLLSELKSIYRENPETMEESQKVLMENLLNFPDKVVSDIMTHRTDIVALEAGEKISDVVYLSINKGFSRFPIYRENIDNIIGMIYVKDLLVLVGNKNSENFSIEMFIRGVKHMASDTSLTDAFKLLRSEKNQIAVVDQDEFGGTFGIITMEDILEEIVGDITDEYDTEDFDIEQISENVYTAAGDISPEEVFDLAGTDFGDSDYDTISAFFIDKFGHIPEENEDAVIEYNGIKMTALVSDNSFIERIKIEFQK
ncbi:MAG: CBS domain-containing protein [Ruminococcus sp.]|jgi:putative hemolysin|nr:CBS domain-containing protein [Ruminococcus sp.]